MVKFYKEIEIYKIVKLSLDSNNPLELYVEDFENAFLEETQKFYENEALTLLRIQSVREFMIKVEKRLDEENKRIIHYLEPSTQTKVNFQIWK